MTSRLNQNKVIANFKSGQNKYFYHLKLLINVIICYYGNNNVCFYYLEWPTSII